MHGRATLSGAGSGRRQCDDTLSVHDATVHAKQPGASLSTAGWRAKSLLVKDIRMVEEPTYGLTKTDQCCP